jgi:hypothetical protein
MAEQRRFNVRRVLTVARVCFTPATETDQLGGLLGWVAADIGEFRFDGLTVRRTAEGKTRIFFPEKKLHGGQRVALARPLSKGAARGVEKHLIARLRAQRALP